MHYICSCGALFGEQKDVFNKFCLAKGHTLLAIDENIYCIIYNIQEINIHLKDTVRKRNRNIAVLKKRIQSLLIELQAFKKM